METSNYSTELHVAQQSRRDKLRVQNHSNPTQNAEVYTNHHLDHLFSGHEGNLNAGLVQLRSFRYGNLSYEPVVFPSEMINLAATSSQQPLLAHSKDAVMLHQDSINSSAKVSGDPQNCSTWKSIGSQESCDWIISNYTSGSAGGIDSNPNPIFVGQGLSASMKSNNSHPPSSTVYMKPSSSYGYHHEGRSSLTSPRPREISSRSSHHKLYGENVNYNSPSVYHNPINVTQELGFAAIPQQNNSETSGTSWPNAGNELVLLPAYAGQSTPLRSNNNACDPITRQVDDQSHRWNGDLVYSESKDANRDDRARPTGNDGSNTQALSLSLSSLPLCKSHGCERMVPEDLHSGAGCFGNLNQDTKILKSDYLCFDVKPSYNGKGLQNDHQDMGGNSTLANNRAVGPLGPFTGYSTILKSSRFLKPAQQLLDEFCNMVGPKSMKMLESPQKIASEIRISCDEVNATESVVGALGGDSGGSSSTFYSSNNEKTQEVGGLSSSTGSFRPEYLQKKAKLLYMLEEVCRRYKHYNQQMQMVVSAFESVAGLSAATPYISQALQSLSRHFRCLRSAISDQLKTVRKTLGEDLSSPTTGTCSSNKADTSMTSRMKLMDQTIQKHKVAGGSVGFFETQHVWRPQRGLPERAVAILRAWLFDHFLHPYPTDADKHMLASQTGLSRNQVSNWFINARVRVWKPMVEEIHMLETKGSAEAGSIVGKSDANTTTHESVSRSNDNQPLNRLSTGGYSEKHVECAEIGPSGFIRSRMDADTWNQKRSRVECHIPGTMDGSLVGFVPYQQSGIDIGSLGAVSLTLGLRRNADGVQPQNLLQQQQQQHDNQLRRHFGDQIIYDFVG